MVVSNKILTVSYGTFSCTLEGFDDSFGTMKAVAEYFRDLAADDRYFGAEPPVPDTEMLAHIAQNEISKRVEAHEDQGKIVLRAAPDPVSTGPQSHEIPPQLSDESNVQAPADMALADTDIDDAEFHTLQDTPEMVNTIVPEKTFIDNDDVETIEPDSIAAKLSRIRSVVSGQSQNNDDEYNEDEHANSFLSATTQDINEALEIDDATEETQTDLDTFYEDVSEEDENIAAILETAIVTEGKSADIEGPDDETLKINNNHSDITATLAGYADDSNAPEEITLSDAFTMEKSDDGDDRDTESFFYAEDGDESALEDTLSQLLFDAMPEDEMDTEGDSLLAVSDIEPETSEEETQNQLNTQASNLESAVEVLSQNARVVKMKRSDYEAAVALGQSQEDDDTSENLFEESDVDLDTGHTIASLDLEGEAELQRALAEVEADLDSDFQNAEMNDEDSSDPLAQYSEPEDLTDISRLFDEVDNKRENPDSSLGRRAIQHLRAAVAATRAEKNAGSQLDTNVDDAPYRDDIATVVKPRRPQVTQKARLLRPSGSQQPAPLKLVAEQRIDTMRGPVQPRRVSATELVTDNAVNPQNSGDDNFEDYAKRMGAMHLPDLLEAAAAYMTDVEGRVQFSRPMLMGKLQEVKQEDYSREDGLRSFGKLLRQEKLKKLKGGRFTVTTQTDFRIETRNVG